MRWQQFFVLFGLFSVLGVMKAVAAEAEKREIIVYKSSTCQCCTAWVDHLRQAEFTVHAHDVMDLMQYKKEADLPYGLGSCHTGFIDGYAIEGHVPASDIIRLLSQQPELRGLALPGMPLGSPGMDVGGGNTLPFTVVGYKASGESTPYRTHHLPSVNDE